MLGEGLARRLAAREGGDLGLRPRRGGFSLPFIFRGRRLHLLKLQLKLIEEPLLALGALAVEFAAQLLDLQPQMGDQRLAARQNRLGVRRLGCDGGGPALRRLRARLGCRQSGAQNCDLRDGVTMTCSLLVVSRYGEGDPFAHRPDSHGRIRKGIPKRTHLIRPIH